MHPLGSAERRRPFHGAVHCLIHFAWFPRCVFGECFFVRTSENTVTRGGRADGGDGRALGTRGRTYPIYIRSRPRAPRAHGARAGCLYSFRRSHEDTRHGNKAKRTNTLAAVVHWRHTAPPKATVWALVVGRSGILVWRHPPPREVRAISESDHENNSARPAHWAWKFRLIKAAIASSLSAAVMPPWLRRFLAITFFTGTAAGAAALLLIAFGAVAWAAALPLAAFGAAALAADAFPLPAEASFGMRIGRCC